METKLTMAKLSIERNKKYYEVLWTVLLKMLLIIDFCQFKLIKDHIYNNSFLNKSYIQEYFYEILMRWDLTNHEEGNVK